MVELLAPVGSEEALVAAVESGANAIYLAGKAFGARAYAPNFTDEDLANAVRFAHLRNVQVYVTVNTLVDDGEMPELARYLRYLYEIDVDAIIVQDIGVAKLANKVVPDLPLHASTQMTVHNLAGVDFLEKIGFTRVVLARELSLDDIKYICKNTKVEIETFVHGALCISYSGQCLMSSMIGGRSGNRGRCAQPCRLPYTLIDESGNNVLDSAEAGEYLLSPRDMNTLDLIPDFIEAGVVSFKIEGRMKRPEYVAIVVDAYRQVIDSFLKTGQVIIDQQRQKELAQIFNRDFTTAYLKGKEGRNMMSDRRPNNRGVRIGRVIDYNHHAKYVDIKLDETLAKDDIVDFWVKVGGRVSSTVTSLIVDGVEVDTAFPGMVARIPVSSPVRINDRVFKVFDAKLMQRARDFFNQSTPKRRIPINVRVDVFEGKPMTISIQDNEGYHSSAETVFVTQKALKRPLTEDVIIKQVDRLGNTIFKIENIECNIGGEVMVPVSEINDARRRAIEELENERLQRFARNLVPKHQVILNELSLPVIQPKKTKPQLVVNVDSFEKVAICIENGADIIMFGGESFNHKPIGENDYKRVAELVHNSGRKLILSTPRLVKEWQVKGLTEDLRLFKSLEPDAVSVGNLGVLEMARDLAINSIHIDYPMNIYNSIAVAFFAERRINSMTLSPELTFKQIEELVKRGPMVYECLVDGYLELMITEFCAVGSYLGKLGLGNCNQACSNGMYWLNDRKNAKFPLVTDQFCRMHVLNSKRLSMLPHVNQFGAIGINRIRIEGKKDSVSELGRVTRLYREILDIGKEHPIFTDSRVLESVEQDITRGHYFRGVL